MMRIVVVTRAGERREIDRPVGHTLKDVLINGGIDEINAISSCGGSCACGTCHVYVDPADIRRLPAMSAQEDDLLYVHDERRTPESRLACQVQITPDLESLTVTVAPEL